MPTPKEIYADTLLDISRRFSNLDDKTIRQLVTLLQDVRKSMAITLADNPTDFEHFRLSSLSESVDQIILDFQSKLNRSISSSIGDAGKLGSANVIDPLDAIGINTSSFNVLSPRQVNIALDFSASLVQKITNDMRDDINTQLRLATLAQKTPFQAMKDVTDVLGVNATDGIWGKRNRPEVVKGVAARAETIVRTEMTRIFNLSQSGTQEEAANIIPGLLKRWVSSGRPNVRQTHLRAHRRYFDNPIPIVEKFRVGNSELMYPGDPRGEAKETINCNCLTTTVISEIGVQVTPVDVAAKEEADKRKRKSQ